MGKKRRSTAPSQPKGPREVDPKDATIKTLDTWEDVADEEDQFHLGRDKVLLEAEALMNRGRKQRDPEEDEEVMDLKNYGYDSENASEEESEEEYGSEESESEGEEAEEQEDDDDDDDDAEILGRKKDEDEIPEGWGTSKKDYYQESEEEADPAAEEEEARRIQKQHLEQMDAADFIFDEDEWSAPAPAAAAATTAQKVHKETLPTTLPEDPAEKQKLLFARHPEFKPLMEEFLALQELFPALEMSAKAAETVGETEKTSAVIRKWKVASAYLGVLSMYFAVLTAAGEKGVEGVREHPVMSALVGVRSAWEKVRGERVERVEKRMSPEKKRKRESVSPSPSGSDASDASASDSDSASGSDSEASDEAESVPVKKPRKSADQDFSDLAALTFKPTSKKPSKTPALTSATTSLPDHLEATTLDATEAADKLTRKRNLRFYTSQIVTKAHKRAAAGTLAGGDLDVPHRERRKERELRLQRETAKRRAEGFGADLDPNASDADDSKKPAKKKSAPDQDEEYYNLLAAAQKGKREKAKQQHEAAKAAAKAGVPLEEAGVDGKRAIGWTIEKNKGLTPFRKKEVRNPRVKKRNAYEKKKIKLASQKAVYKGGLQGAYGGELTGIKKNLVKSVKFA